MTTHPLYRHALLALLLCEVVVLVAGGMRVEVVGRWLRRGRG